jgi:tol-pal system protein YbgF
MKSYVPLVGFALLVSLGSLVPNQAHAFLSDNEARRELIKLREQVDELTVKLNNKIDPLSGRIDAKADKKIFIDLAADFDRLRNEIANLRGQIELLSNDLANGQRRQKDFYTDLDARLSKLEPRKLTVDGKDAEVDKAEQKAFEQALSFFNVSNYQAADQAFTSFIQRYPDSVYIPSAHYWLGGIYFAQRDCAKALPMYQVVVARYPTSEKVPESLLKMASCQIEMKDKSAAKENLDTLIKNFPSSNAAKVAKERMTEVK